MASVPNYPLLTAEEFLEIDFGERKAELDNGVIRMMAGGTARTDLRVKLEEYRDMPSVDTIVFVDIASERVRIVQRTGARAWSDVTYTDPFDIPLPSIGATLRHADLFARD